MAEKKIVVKNISEKIIVRAAGARGPAGGSSYLKGLGVPSSHIGSDGDSYLDLNTSLLYTKMSGVWGNPVQSVARSAISYTHTQNQPTDTWVVNHNLGFQPAVSVMDFAGTNVECEVKYSTDQNTVTLKFYQNDVAIEVSGYAYLS